MQATPSAGVIAAELLRRRRKELADLAVAAWSRQDPAEFNRFAESVSEFDLRLLIADVKRARAAKDPRNDEMKDAS